MNIDLIITMNVDVAAILKVLIPFIFATLYQHK